MFKKNQNILDGRVRMGEKVGKGSFGEVWRVERVKTGEALAAKFERSEKAEEMSMLKWEAMLLY